MFDNLHVCATERFCRMLKKSVQQGRSEWRPEAYPQGYVGGSERCENEAGGFFQRPVESDSLEEQYRQGWECNCERIGHPMRRNSARMEPAPISHVAPSVGRSIAV
jgi:hypothetical protein